MSSALDRLEQQYQARHSRNLPQPVEMDPEMSSILEGPIQPRDSATIDDLSPDRDSMKRIQWVFDRIVDMVPHDNRKDTRYVMMSAMMRESIKDLALIPDRIIVPMVQEIAGALSFVANGTMAELEEAIAAQRDNAEEG